MLRYFSSQISPMSGNIVCRQDFMSDSRHVELCFHNIQKTNWHPSKNITCMRALTNLL